MESDSITNARTLDSLRPGDKAVVLRVNAEDSQVQRLMVLGMVEGVEIERTGSAIGGDPIEFRLFGSSISLRQEHARCFEVSVAVALG